MSDRSHYRKLERLFQAAPLNQGIFKGSELEVEFERATLRLTIGNQYFHAADAMHGAIYFKLLDDSAYFAAASIEKTYFLLTKSYTIHFRRPVMDDTLTAIGKVTEVNEREILAASEIYNSAGKLVANGEGIFVKGPNRLDELYGFK
uniref:PaaI family thioesterase n=1 Tax=Roseivirga sp. TaxID=1964215 RepID=UPI00404849F2